MELFAVILIFIVAAIFAILGVRQFLQRGKLGLNKYEAELFADKRDAYKYAGIKAIHIAISAIVLGVLILIGSKYALDITAAVFLVGLFFLIIFLATHNIRK